jgi:hypothetical protein
MPWWKRPPTSEPDPAAIEARHKAERELEVRRAETSRVKEVIAGWRQIREKNHFAPAINATFRGGNP